MCPPSATPQSSPRSVYPASSIRIFPLSSHRAPKGGKKRRRKRRKRWRLAKSVLGLEEAARQLLFLRSGKSSLESNLPVCYCIRTTSPAALRYLPLPYSFYDRCSSSVLRSLLRVCSRARTRGTLRLPLVSLCLETREFCVHASRLAFR